MKFCDMEAIELGLQYCVLLYVARSALPSIPDNTSYKVLKNLRKKSPATQTYLNSLYYSISKQVLGSNTKTWREDIKDLCSIFYVPMSCEELYSLLTSTFTWSVVSRHESCCPAYWK